MRMWIHAADHPNVHLSWPVSLAAFWCLRKLLTCKPVFSWRLLLLRRAKKCSLRDDSISAEHWLFLPRRSKSRASEFWLSHRHFAKILSKWRIINSLATCRTNWFPRPYSQESNEKYKTRCLPWHIKESSKFEFIRTPLNTIVYVSILTCKMHIVTNISSINSLFRCTLSTRVLHLDCHNCSM